MKPEGEVTNSCKANTGCKHTASAANPLQKKTKKKQKLKIDDVHCGLALVCYLLFATFMCEKQLNSGFHSGDGLLFLLVQIEQIVLVLKC